MMRITSASCTTIANASLSLPAKMHFGRKHEGMIDLYNHPDVYDFTVMPSWQQDKDFYLAQARDIKAPILEVTCGTGRTTIPLAQQGADVTGLDLSETMLKKAQEKADQAGVKINFVKGDATDFKLDRKFGLITVPASGLLLLNSKEDINKFLQRAYEHLLPGGKLIFDIIPSTSPIIRLPADFKFASHHYTLPSGEKINMIEEGLHYDPQEKTFRYSFSHINDKTGKEIRRDTPTLRIYTPEEIRAMAYQNGFSISNEYGDFSGTPYNNESNHLVMVCRK